MLRVMLFHLYIAVMALIVVTTSHIIADHYGTRLLSAITGTVTEAKQDVSNVKNKVKNWNKTMLD